jgi:DNA-directed RNA polymerase specialized sigma24 family protein
VAYDEIPASQDEPGAEQAIPLSLEESLSYDRPVLPEPESASEHQKLTEAISRLPTFLREVLVLNLWGNSVQEIADAIGTSHETARRRLQAALEAVSVDLS